MSRAARVHPPTRYPCQDPAGLPSDLAAALARWSAMSPQRTAYQCCVACETITRDLGHPTDLHIVGGYARMFDPPTIDGRRMDGMLHWWLERDGRVLDPTRQQLGRGPVAYWRALPAHQNADGYALIGAVRRLLGGVMDAEGSGRRVTAELCEPKHCYQDQGRQRARRTSGEAERNAA